MCSESLIRNLINVTKKMPLKEMLEELEAKPRYWKNILNGVSPEQKIYRTEPCFYFQNNLKQKKLYFAYPGTNKNSCWRDTFDGAFVRINIYFKRDNIKASQAYKLHYFCQCWSLEESAGMWARCPENDNRVMMVSTVDKIMKQIWTDEPCGKYVGLVVYRPVKKIREKSFFQSECGSSCYIFNEIGIPSTFLFKPDSLSFEKEIRFIARKKVDQQLDDIMIDTLTEPKDYIDRVIIDPRANESVVKCVQDAANKYGLAIERSKVSIEDIRNVSKDKCYKPDENNYGLPDLYSFEE